jgi:hypothetical protein
MERFMEANTPTPENLEISTMRNAANALIAIADTATLRRFFHVFGDASIIQPVVPRVEPQQQLQQQVEQVERPTKRGIHRRDPHSVHSLVSSVMKNAAPPLGIEPAKIVEVLRNAGHVDERFDLKQCVRILTRSPSVFSRLPNGNWMLRKNRKPISDIRID